MKEETAVDVKALFLKGTEGLDASKPTIKALNFSHEAIARWMLANPGAKLGQCAKEFNYTPGWLSIIVHSDAFQAKYRELQQEADSAVIADIPAKMRGVASLALEGLADQVESAVEDKTVAPRDFLLKTSESLLKALGYGTTKNVTVNNNAPGAQTNFVEAGALSRARERLVTPRPNEPKLIGSGTSETPT